MSDYLTDAINEGSLAQNENNTTLLTKTEEVSGNNLNDELESSGNYQLTFAPDLELDHELLNDYHEIAHELGLSQNQAQRLADLYAERISGNTEKFQSELMGNIKEQNQLWEEEIKKSPTFKKDLDCATRTLARFGDDKLYQVLNQSGLGSNPAMFRFTAAVGQALGEPGFKGKTSQYSTDPAQVMYPNHR